MAGLFIELEVKPYDFETACLIGLMAGFYNYYDGAVHYCK